jgi:hypothetical protein
MVPHDLEATSTLEVREKAVGAVEQPVQMEHSG